MLKTRVIPVLLLQDGGLVKGERFRKHKYVGDPINAVRIFNEKEVDELAVIDISSTLNGLEPDYSSIEDIASEAFMPIAYGGGITTTHQVERIFRSGAEKVIINTAFVTDPDFVKDCSRIAGSQSIAISIDVRRSLLGRYEVFTHNATRKTGQDPVAYAMRAEDMGAGELILTSVDREGTATGFDLDLILRVTQAVSIPVIAQGGCGSLDDLKSAVFVGRASAVAASTFFTFHGKHRAVLLTYPTNKELEVLFNE